MKKMLSLFALASLAASAVIFSPGCSSTPTRSSTGEYIDDSVVTTKVKAELLHDDKTPGTAIKVDTFKGVVQLSGFVDTSEQKARAGVIAGSISGVREVVNNIVVK